MAYHKININSKYDCPKCGTPLEPLFDSSGDIDTLYCPDCGYERDVDLSENQEIEADEDKD